MIDFKKVLMFAAVLAIAHTSFGSRAETVCSNPQQNVQQTYCAVYVCTKFNKGHSGTCSSDVLLCVKLTGFDWKLVSALKQTPLQRVIVLKSVMIGQ